MFERQYLHAVLLLALLAAAAGFYLGFPALFSGHWLGVSTRCWFWVALGVPVLHQYYVWFFWRAQLHYSAVSNIFGAQRGFALYAAGFAVLFAARLATLVALAVSSRNTLPINTGIGFALSALLAIPWGYAMYSVLRYFGLRRAFGIDHFDPAFRHIPFVRKGIFRFTTNGMYGPGFLVVWIPALLAASAPALVAAAFSHAYIWVHYYTTELPDIHLIYGPRPKNLEP